MSAGRSQNNRMLSFLFVVSLSLHLGVFIYLNEFYKQQRVTRIEVTIKNVEEPTKRVIPKPKDRTRPPGKAKDLERLTLTQSFPQNLEPLSIDKGDYSYSKEVESPRKPHFVKSGDPLAPVGNSQTSVDSNASLSSQEYLTKVRLRIERHKQYPNAAKTRQLQGAVVIHFLITLDGNVEAVQVTKSSGHSILDQAGLTAVRDAAPFPKPPAELFKSSIPIQVPIVFELT